MQGLVSLPRKKIKMFNKKERKGKEDGMNTPQHSQHTWNRPSNAQCSPLLNAIPLFYSQSTNQLYISQADIIIQVLTKYIEHSFTFYSPKILWRQLCHTEV